MSGPVRITHPFHPRRGQEIAAVFERTQWGERRVYYRSELGHLTSIPSAWTSLVEPDPYEIVGGGRSPFRADDLVELTSLVAELRAHATKKCVK